MASARRPAVTVDPDLDEQWRAIDGVLATLAERARSRRGTDEEDLDEPAVRTAAPPSAVEAELRHRLEIVTRERDRLRKRLATAQRDLRDARAELVALRERPRLAVVEPVPDAEVELDAPTEAESVADVVVDADRLAEPVSAAGAEPCVAPSLPRRLWRLVVAWWRYEWMVPPPDGE